MTIRVLLADDSDFMRGVLVKFLKEDPIIHLVGEASSFAETMEQTAALKPDVLLMDLHMHDEFGYPPEQVRAEVFRHTTNLVAMSVWNDDKAQELSEKFGARVLVDKMKMFDDLIPTLKQCHCVSSRATISAQAPASHGMD